MSVNSLLTQALVTKRRLDGHLTQKLEAARSLNMGAVLATKITLIPKKSAINDAHLKVRSIFVCSVLLCYVSF